MCCHSYLNIQPRCTCLFFYREKHVSIILSACIFNISDQICLGTWVTNIMSCAPRYYPLADFVSFESAIA